MAEHAPIVVQIDGTADASTLRRLAHLLAREGLWRAAGDVFAGVLRLAPTDWRSHLRRYDAYAEAGDSDGCRRALDAFVASALASRTSPTPLLRLLDGTGHAVHARSLLEASAHADPGNWRLGLQSLERAASPGDVRVALQRLFAVEGPLRSVQHRAILDQLAERRLVGKLDEALHAIASIRAGDWRLRWHGVCVLHALGDPAAACPHMEALAGDAALSTPVRRALLQQVSGHGATALLAAALEGYDRIDRAGLLALLGHGGDAHQLDRTQAAVMQVQDDAAREAMSLALARAMEVSGEAGMADALISSTRAGRNPGHAPDSPSPTASTLMFRNLPLLRQLLALIEAIVATKGHARIHVGACSTGEEVYSLALLLQQRGLLDSCRLRASDVDPALLARARTGVLELQAVHAIPDDIGPLDLEPRPDGRSELGPETRAAIEFAIEDLCETGPGPRFDLMVANNVLVHLPQAMRETMIERLADRLDGDGLLCIGGVRHDEMGPLIERLGLVAVEEGSDEAFDAWTIQHSAWYVSPRPYWALPPARYTLGERWKHASLFARSLDRARWAADVLQARHP
ncbi:CheR family methyltransferase [Luteimonas sp. M1R5S18]|uniref:CheR family methyltransferase n=1 Tax=Luteimonas rhizosphaericola TaxID=3042024 RepID=A0ABT6JP09_9GAMM|nr:CheR family methyltransferase [Luteimonas rhizosphaericola]MDH5831826.1 CheR family methyltransferase [Luteimonas rhizosphaericola]